MIEAETGRPDVAIERWAATVRLDPRDFDALFNLGLMLRKQGRAGEARAVLERFAREAPPSLYAADIRRARGWLAGILTVVPGPLPRVRRRSTTGPGRYGGRGNHASGWRCRRSCRPRRRGR